VSVPFPEPTDPASSRAEVFLRYLDFFRDRVIGKLRGLPPTELHESRLMSGWAPIELMKHLQFVEMRWLEWGFEGQDVTELPARQRLQPCPDLGFHLDIPQGYSVHGICI